MEKNGSTSIMLMSFTPAYTEQYLSVFSPLVRDILHVTSLESERAYLIQLMQESSPFFFGVMLEPVHEFIGAIAIRNPQLYAGQLYCWMHEKYWGAGYFQQALADAAAFYFAQTNYDFFTARVDLHNMRSYQALKKCGFIDRALVQGPYGLQFELVRRREKL